MYHQNEFQCIFNMDLSLHLMCRDITDFMVGF